MAWRQRADQDLLTGLRDYEAAIADTIGLRGQAKLPKDQALFVASCNADHRDLSLSF